ncbi:MAG TPA: hemin uptake protein HemP [Limnobacter sp.]|nr:hemin uptake protein HemP [Limnobacter sp.]
MQCQSTPLTLPTRDDPVASLAQPLVVQSDALFPPGQREIMIEHGTMQYRLRITAQGKLILTK